jgi:glycosyltransferase involved in cell wall biosynthesis
MRIGVDLTALTPQHTGVDRFLISLVEHLARITTEHRFYIFANREDLHLFRGILPEGFRIYGVCFRPRLARIFFQQMMLPLASLLLRLDAIHSPSFIMPLFRGRARHILTVHDLTTMTLPEAHIRLRRSVLFSLAMTRSMRKADVLHVPSEFVKEDIGRHIEGVDRARILVIPHGIGDHFSPQAAERAPQVAKSLGIPAPFILYVGNIDPRKNLSVLVRSYGDLVARNEIEEHLVIAGPLGWGYDELLRLCGPGKQRGRIHFTSYVPEADLPALIAGARLFVYPSRQEGFGFPPLEAMACGIPVIASRSSSLAENLEGAASLVPVDDETALRDEIKRLLSDDDLRARRREQGLKRAAEFTWEETAKKMLRAYERSHGYQSE